jgi:hypothetical protein
VILKTVGKIPDGKKQDEVERNEETRGGDVGDKDVEESQDSVCDLAATDGEENRDSALEDNLHILDDVEKQTEIVQDGATRRDSLLSLGLENNKVPQPAKTPTFDTLPEGESASGDNLKTLRESYATPRDDVHLPMNNDLQNISQPQAEVDKSQLVNELRTMKHDVNALEVKAAPHLWNMLSTVTYTESPSFAAWVPCEASDN